MKTLAGHLFYFLIVVTLISCKTKEFFQEEVKSNKKEIYDLSIKDIPTAVITFDETTSTYNISVPFGTKLNSLALSFSLSEGASSNPKSGSTQNFSTPVYYIVTAEDGTEISYKISVNVLPNSDGSNSSSKNIIDFQLIDYLPPLIGKIVENFNTIIFHTTDHTVDLQRIKTKITLSPNATVFPESGVRTDFSVDPIYKVTAADGSTKSYTVRLRGLEKYLPTNDLKYIISTYKNNIFIIDSESGAEIWRYKCDSDLTSPTSDGKNIFASSNTKLYAFEIETGKLLWTSNFDTNIGTDSQQVPIFDENKSTIFYRGDGLYAISASTGNRLWKFENNNSKKVTIYGFISYSSNIVFAMFKDEINEMYKLVALNSSNGSKKWEFESKFQFYYVPKIYDGKIFIATSWKNLYAIDISNGTKVWEFIENSSYPKFTHSVIYNGTLYIGSSFDLLAIDTNNGNLKWRTKNEDYVQYGPYIEGGILYLNVNLRSGSTAGVRLHTINPETGTKLTTKIIAGFNGKNFLYSNNLLVYKKIIFLSDGGGYYPIDGNTNTICYSYGSGYTPCLITKSGNVILSSLGK